MRKSKTILGEIPTINFTLFGFFVASIMRKGVNNILQYSLYMEKSNETYCNTTAMAYNCVVNTSFTKIGRAHV